MTNWVSTAEEMNVKIKCGALESVPEARRWLSVLVTEECAARGRERAVTRSSWQATGVCDC